jgi:hypothetical protein
MSGNRLWLVSRPAARLFASPACFYQPVFWPAWPAPEPTRACPSWIAISRRADRAPEDKVAAMAIISRSKTLLALALLILSGSAGALWWAVARPGDSQPMLATSAAAEDDPSNPIETTPPPPAASALDAQAALLPAPLAGIRLARQSLKRGGLGSKVHATFTVRNRHDFAIKDVEIQCAFRARDGYTTQRRRVIHDTIEPRSRETFANVLVGHINVTTTRGKCHLLGASRA